MKNIDKIKKAIKNHRWKLAEKEILRILKIKHNEIELLELLLKVYVEKNEDQKAYKIGKRIYLLAPNDPLVLWAYAAVSSNVFKNREAIRLYLKLLRKSNNVLARHPAIRSSRRAMGFKLDIFARIGECYFEIGEYINAIQYFKKYLDGKTKYIPSEYNKQDVKEYYIKCFREYLFNEKKYNKNTYKLAEKAYAFMPYDPLVMYSFAGWANNMHKYREAIRIYKKILRKSENSLSKHPEIGNIDTSKGFKLDTCVRIGECYMGMDDYASAIPFFIKYINNKRKNIPSEYKMKAVKEYLRECQVKLMGKNKYIGI